MSNQDSNSERNRQRPGELCSLTLRSYPFSSLILSYCAKERKGNRNSALYHKSIVNTVCVKTPPATNLQTHPPASRVCIISQFTQQLWWYCDKSKPLAAVLMVEVSQHSSKVGVILVLKLVTLPPPCVFASLCFVGHKSSRLLELVETPKRQDCRSNENSTRVSDNFLHVTLEFPPSTTDTQNWEPFHLIVKNAVVIRLECNKFRRGVRTASPLVRHHTVHLTNSNDSRDPA